MLLIFQSLSLHPLPAGGLLFCRQSCWRFACLLEMVPFATSKGKYNWSHNKIDYLLSGNSLRCFACGSSHSRGHRRPAQKQLRSGGPASCVFPMVHRSSTSAISLFPMAPPASNIFQIALRHGAPASNKPHPAEKSTPVWLAIWRIWAGFANSQLRRATFSSTYLYMCLSTLLPHRAAAQTQQICRPICTDCLRHLRISAG